MKRNVKKIVATIVAGVSIFSATVFAAPADVITGYSAIVFNHANVGSHFDGDLYAGSISGAIHCDPNATITVLETNGEYKNGKPIELGSHMKLSYTHSYYLSKAKTLQGEVAPDLTNANSTIDVQPNTIYNVEVKGSSLDWRTKVTMNGAVVPDYSSNASKVVWNFGDFNGDIYLNSDSLFGIILAPNANLHIVGCGNYDGMIIVNNLKAQYNEFHGIVGIIPDPVPTITPEPTVVPEPTDEPVATSNPTVVPEPTEEPTVTTEPTMEPTKVPEPTVNPTLTPEPSPTVAPTKEPVETIKPVEPTITPESTDMPFPELG